MLIVFSGLPGTGKTSISRLLAEKATAVYLRIDTIEQSLEKDAANIGAAGYNVAVEIAKENLRLGRTVVVDAVNAVEIAREAWLSAAGKAGTEILEIEVICSNATEHKRRVETRVADIESHRLPTWQDVLSRKYEDWTRPHLTVDTASKRPGDIVQLIQQQMKSLKMTRLNAFSAGEMKP